MNQKLTYLIMCSISVFVAVGCSSGVSEVPEKPEQVVSALGKGVSVEPGVLIAYPPVPVQSKTDIVTQDLLSNSGFEIPLEDEPRTWTANPESIAINVEREIVAEGKHALKIEPGNAKNISLTQTFKVPRQSRYELQGLALPQNVNGAVKLIAHDGAGGHYAAESISTPGNSVPWSQLLLRINAPAFVKELIVGVEYVATAQNIYDGPSLLLLDRFKLIDRGAPTNMLANGDFAFGATGTDSWFGSENLEIVKEETGFVADTSSAIKVTLPGNRNLGIYQTVVGLELGKSYVCRAYIKCENLVGDACVELQHGTKGFNAFMQRSQILTGTQDWQWVNAEFTPQNDMTSVAVILRRPAAGANAVGIGNVWFARCELFSADE